METILTSIRAEAVAKAIDFAEKKHAGQIRRYVGEPYVEHVKRVATTVATVGGTTEAIVAALLHDTIEDTDTTRAEIEALFGPLVADYVVDLTDVRPQGMSRARHKELRAIELSRRGSVVHTIKLADFLDNAVSIVEHDPKFARVFMAEMRYAVELLYKGDAGLREKARAMVKDYEEGLVQAALKKGDPRYQALYRGALRRARKARGCLSKEKA